MASQALNINQEEQGKINEINNQNQNNMNNDSNINNNINVEELTKKIREIVKEKEITTISTNQNQCLPEEKKEIIINESKIVSDSKNKVKESNKEESIKRQ